jgi:LTXXQ motif family protein
LGLRAGFVFREQRSALEIRPLLFCEARPRKMGRSVVRSAIPIFLAILAFATPPARAQGTWLETKLIRAVCSSKETSPANTDRLAKRLNLTDPQKAALKDLAEASATADTTAKTSLCADKPDLSTTPGRMAFAEKMAETKLAGLKAVEPKLQAFYDSLDGKQKKAFDTGGRIGGIFDWWRKK